MRYGHQPISEIMELSLDDLAVLTEEIMSLVNQENNIGRVED